MNEQLNGAASWKRYFGPAAFAIALLVVSFQPAVSATNPVSAIAITDGKEQFMSTLASMPYTSTGTGPVLYVLGCLTCPFTQAFEKDWKGQLGEVEVRRIFIVTKTDDAKTIHAFNSVVEPL